nr:mitotic checkpoint serine/threonine-protein kinase BUB1 beta [Leptinotarsa decemlineata]
MDFDLSKENIQPLRGGRNVHQLGMALQAQTNREFQLELLQQKEQFEHLIRTYTGEDPLENYYNYISWIEQSYPKHGHEGNLVPLLEHCLCRFENDKRYTNDRRFCKLLIKYFDLHPNPLELYHMLKAKGLCIGCADLYRAWAYYHEAAGDFHSANNVFEEGKRNLAQPYEDLDTAHKNLIMAAGQHCIFGRDENQLVEKRQALTSLHTYRPGRVSSIRVPSSNGVVTVPSHPSVSRPNATVHIYTDKNVDMSGPSTEAAPISIVTAAKRQDVRKENTLKPGPWTTVPVKKRVVGPITPAFVVHQDVPEEPEGLRLPKNHPKQCLEDYSDFIVSITYPEPPNPAHIPMYPKAQVYRDPNTEYSIEEIRAPKYSQKALSRQLPQEEQQILEDVEFMQESLHEIKNDIFQRSMALQQNEIFQRSLQEHQNSFQQCPQQDDQDPKGYQPRSPFQKQEQLLMSVNQPSSPYVVQQEVTPLTIWTESPVTSNFEIFSSPQSFSKPVPTNFVVYEQSLQEIQPHMQAKGSAMKTAFKVLNADELAETGSRGGMDIADTAQANDSAKPMPQFSDNSASSFEDLVCQDRTDFEIPCDTYAFNFNLNAMQVSTPQNKRPVLNTISNEEEFGNTRKQLFTEPKIMEKHNALSTILEETKSFRNSFACNMGCNLYLQKIGDPYENCNNVKFHGVSQKACIAWLRPNSDREKYIVEKQLGKGTFGTVFKALDLDSNATVALKYQKPANKWEFYICRELQARLAEHPLRDRFMDIPLAYFGDQASILISAYMPGGSLLDLANSHKLKFGTPMKESLVIYFCIQMLQIIQAMHEVKIIHADIKPDNFLVFVLPDNTVGLQLIDFGCSIDMTLFPEKASFTRRVTTEDFVCCEMMDGRPWNYHTDLFCVAATAHVLFFDAYIKLKKQDGLWSIVQRFPRYSKVDLWNMFFSSLLNQQTGPADTATLLFMLGENLETKDSSTALSTQMRNVVNLLKNR